ncbi:hypothetical protein [Campylobacter concisus]|uniref:hypothetical protein n=1 Tax=Campylobacter concisus TaxID=199 RepID=UPI001F1E0FFE|nr:hypothetical protein [Campylobacter concisus]
MQQVFGKRCGKCEDINNLQASKFTFSGKFTQQKPHKFTQNSQIWLAVKSR